jgi:hypothetical protein
VYDGGRGVVRELQFMGEGWAGESCGVWWSKLAALQAWHQDRRARRRRQLHYACLVGAIAVGQDIKQVRSGHKVEAREGAALGLHVVG